MQVQPKVKEADIDSDYGSVPGLIVTCGRCGLSVSVRGVEDRSAKRAAVMLREKCRYQESNYYIVST